MKSWRIALLAMVTAFLVALVGCEAVNEAVGADMEKAPAAIGTLAYAPTQPLQASYIASTSGAPTWHRLDEYGYLGYDGTDVPNHVQPFEVGGAGSYQIYSMQDYDGYLLLYGGSFDPTAPSAGFIAGGDDFGDVGDSRVIADLVDDTTYYLVTSGYDNDSYGSFTNASDGPYAVTLFGDEDPIEATHSLIADVEQLEADGVLKAGQADGLIKPLENALRSLEKDQPEDACNQLGNFIMEVEAKVPPLTETQANELVASAAAIQEVLGYE